MAVEWKEPGQRRVVLLLAGAAVLVLSLGIGFRPRQQAPAAAPASPPQIPQLQERVEREAFEQPSKFLQRLAQRQAPTLAYAPDLDSTVLILDDEGWAMATAARVPARRRITLLLPDATMALARMVAADPLHGLYLLRLEDATGTLPIQAEQAPDRLQGGDALLSVGLDRRAQLVLASGRLARPVHPGDATLNFSGALPADGLGALFLTMDETVVGLRVREREAVRDRSWNFAGGIIAELRQKGVHAHPDLGVRVHDLSLLERQRLDVPGRVVVSGVIPADPDSQQEIRPGDVLLEVNGQQVTAAGNFHVMVAGLTVGAPATLTLWQDGERRAVQLQVETTEELERRAVGAVPLPGFGLYLAPAPDTLRVIEVEPWSLAARAGLEPGDLLLRVDGRQFGSVALLERYLRLLTMPALTEIQRGSQPRILRLPPLAES